MVIIAIIEFPLRVKLMTMSFISLIDFAVVNSWEMLLDFINSAWIFLAVSFWNILGFESVKMGLSS